MATRTRFFAFSHSTLDALFSTVYQGLAINICVGVACLPLILLLLTVAEPLASWPLCVLFALLCGPALSAAFGTFARSHEDGETRPFAHYISAYRKTFARSLLVWGAVVALATVAAADVVVLAQRGAAQVLVPCLGVVVVLALVVALTMLSGLSTAPTLGLWELLKVSCLLTVRFWYLSIFSLLLVVALCAVVLVSPTFGVLVTPGFLLYVIWSNSRYGFGQAAHWARAAQGSHAQ